MMSSARMPSKLRMRHAERSHCNYSVPKTPGKLRKIIELEISYKIDIFSRKLNSRPTNQVMMCSAGMPSKLIMRHAERSHCNYSVPKTPGKLRNRIELEILYQIGLLSRKLNSSPPNQVMMCRAGMPSKFRMRHAERSHCNYSVPKTPGKLR